MPADPAPSRRRPLAALLLLPLAWPLPAAAQLRSVAVPAGAGVVVAPRGQAAPRLVAPPRGMAVAEPAAPVQLAPGPGLAGPMVGILLPAAAAALLGSSLAGGGGGGGGGPVRTR
ncbi:hypothetical protein [Roseomonas haemaphysalidis]|uniref:Uncharacterized protein n=1 Tax=Roseomonas haemaphysalidis TaxID=2768162 RepID=A0ABS3KV89_9PROT|nr:hypothetical protein [Roseomonas haemaphysalidis]MBO1081398.1 hypothetical protein [Roseomonas haemaphysalidis]